MFFNFDVPISQVSFGQVAFNLLKPIYKSGRENICIFPRQNFDFNSFSQPFEEFKHDFEGYAAWMTKLANEAYLNFSRDNPTFKLWHIHGIGESYGKDQVVMTFHETSALTKSEKQLLKSQKAVIVTSKYTEEVFKSHGLRNVKYAQIGLDDWYFRRIEEPITDHDPEIITFGLRGKLEVRKHTIKIIKAWSKKYGKNKKYRLNCSVSNPFLDVDIIQLITHHLGGEIPWNINFIPFQVSNRIYNKILNSSDIDLTGLSGCEGFNLPLFQSLCCGRQAVVLNAHVHKDYCTDKNSILIDPCGQIDADDGLFFRKGTAFNQGTWFDFDEDDAISAMEKAEIVAKVRNTEGELLKDTFTSESGAKVVMDTLLS